MVKHHIPNLAPKKLAKGSFSYPKLVETHFLSPVMFFQHHGDDFSENDPQNGKLPNFGKL